VQTDAVIYPAAAKRDRAFSNELIRIQNEKRPAAICRRSDSYCVVSKLLDPIIYFDIMSARTPGIVVVDDGCSTVSQSLGFRKRHLLAKDLLASPSWIIVDKAVVRVGKYDIGVRDTRKNPLEPSGPPC
jgi:hypothetical protein